VPANARVPAPNAPAAIALAPPVSGFRLGATFDPEFLGRLGLDKLQANPAEARSWYSRARDLGAIDAKPQPNSFETRQGK